MLNLVPISDLRRYNYNHKKFTFFFVTFLDMKTVLGTMLLLLLPMLQSVVAFNDSINADIFLQVLEDLASESLGVEEIQVYDGFFQS